MGYIMKEKLVRVTVFLKANLHVSLFCFIRQFLMKFFVNKLMFCTIGSPPNSYTILMGV